MSPEETVVETENKTVELENSVNTDGTFEGMPPREVFPTLPPVENSVNAENSLLPDKTETKIEPVGWKDAVNHLENSVSPDGVNLTTEGLGDLNPDSVLSEFNPGLHVISDEIIEDESTEPISVIPIPEGQMMLSEGTKLFLGKEEIVLASEALIHWTSAEYALAGALAVSGAENMRLNNKHLQLNYDSNGMLQPLANQPGVEDMPKFCSTISAEEANALGIKEYEAYLRIWEEQTANLIESIDPAAEATQVSENLNS